MQTQISAGDTLDDRLSAPGYSAADGWVMHIRLVPVDGSAPAIELTAGADGALHRVQAQASVTAAWEPGRYSWAAWVVRGADEHTVQSGHLVITPNPRTASAGWDNRSQARKALEDAKAALAAWKPTQRRYKINQREMEFNSTADIIKLITYWERQVLQEDILAGRASAPARRIYTRM